VLGGATLAATVSVDPETNVGYQAFAALTAVLLVSGGWCWAFSGKFSAVRFLPRYGTAGLPLGYTVELQNQTPWRQRDLVLLEGLAHTRPSFAQWLNQRRELDRGFRSFRFSLQRPPLWMTVKARETPVPPVAPGEVAKVRLELLPTRRGVLRFERLGVGRPDPLGLCRAFCRLPLPQSVSILPRRYALPAIALPGNARYQPGGVALASSVGQSEDFIALRDYRRGDPLRHIHWRSWAKIGRPVVKEFEDEFFVRHALVLDTFSRSEGSLIFEEAVSIAASFACAVRTQENLLDLLFVGPQSYCFTAGRGLAHTEQMLEILSAVQPCEKPFVLLEALVLEHVRQVSGCICVLLGLDRERQEFLGKLETLGVSLLVLVVVPPGQGEVVRAQVVKGQTRQIHVLEADKVEGGLANLS
jgi:uncharacterized protein (DUF58 family)